MPVTHCLITRLGIIAIQGQDAVTFLQGQTTCDVRQVGPSKSCSGALCNPKGRVIATFRLLRGEEGFFMLLDADLLDTVLKRLKMFVLRAKVALSDASADWSLHGMIGTDLPEALRAGGLQIPEEAEGAWSANGLLAVRPASDPLRCLVMAPSGAPTAWLDKPQAVEESVWWQAEIASGLAHIGAALSEEFVPQMLNLDLTNAISFTKGCYTGQEVVARTHYLGQAKRRLLRYGVEDVCQPGLAIYAEGQTESVGTVVNSAGGELLAVVASGQQTHRLRLGGSHGPLMQRLPLPYDSELSPKLDAG